MEEEKVHLGEGIADEAKNVLNKETKEIISATIKAFSKKIKEKIPELPDMVGGEIKNIADSQKVIDEITKEWSEELYDKGLVPKGYSGLPDKLLIHNFHQEGYLDGMYVGSNLIGHWYDDRNEFIDKFKAEKYQTIFKQKKSEK